MNERKNNFFTKLFAVRGMRSALIAFAGWIVIYIAFGLISPVVFSSVNILNLLRAMSKYVLIGVAQSFLLISGLIDLSIGSLVAVSAMISATLMTQGVNPFLSCAVAMAVCLFFGVINGVLVGYFKIQPFIATLGTMFCGRGVAYLVNGNHDTDAISSGIGQTAADKFTSFFYYGKTLGVYNAFWLTLILFAILFFVLQKTVIGRKLYAIGSNENAAKLSGINITSGVIFAYLISAACSCIVGYILCAQAGMGSMEAGNGYEMYSIAASVIGGVSPLGGTGILLGTFAGAGVWQTLENGLGITGTPVGIQKIVVGIIVVLSLLADVLIRKRKK